MKKFVSIYFISLVLLLLFPIFLSFKYSLVLNLPEFVTELYKAIWGLFNILIIFLLFDYLAKKIITNDLQNNSQKTLHSITLSIPDIMKSLPLIIKEIEENIIFDQKESLNKQLLFVKSKILKLESVNVKEDYLINNVLLIFRNQKVINNIDLISKYLMTEDDKISNQYYLERAKELLQSLSLLNKCDVPIANKTNFNKLINYIKTFLSNFFSRK